MIKSWAIDTTKKKTILVMVLLALYGLATWLAYTL